MLCDRPNSRRSPRCRRAECPICRDFRLDNSTIPHISRKRWRSPSTSTPQLCLFRSTGSDPPSSTEHLPATGGTSRTALRLQPRDLPHRARNSPSRWRFRPLSPLTVCPASSPQVESRTNRLWIASTAPYAASRNWIATSFCALSGAAAFRATESYAPKQAEQELHNPAPAISSHH